jgi:hypothetical protein
VLRADFSFVADTGLIATLPPSVPGDSKQQHRPATTEPGRCPSLREIGEVSGERDLGFAGGLWANPIVRPGAERRDRLVAIGDRPLFDSKDVGSDCRDFGVATRLVDRFVCGGRGRLAPHRPRRGDFKRSAGGILHGAVGVAGALDAPA